MFIAAERQMIIDVLDEYEATTCLSFDEQAVGDYMNFVTGSG